MTTNMMPLSDVRKHPLALYGENVAVSMLKEGKLVYDNGSIIRVWSHRNGWKYKHTRADTLSTRGYRFLAIRIEYQLSVSVKAHRAIWRYFYGNIPDGYEINHDNGDKGCNRIDNLLCVTHSENVIHAFKTGLHGKLLLDHATAEEIRELYAARTYTQRSLAKRFGVSPQLISEIITKKCYI